jgi:serine/threonine protein kinase
MVNGTPLFKGTSEETQLDIIFRHLGTPTEATFPGLSELPDWKDNFPPYPAPHSLQELVPKLDDSGVDLLNQMLIYDPTQRITAQNARQHRFFESLPEPLRNAGNDMT